MGCSTNGIMLPENNSPAPVTPAMEAGIADHVWILEEIVGLLP